MYTLENFRITIAFSGVGSSQSPTIIHCSLLRVRLVTLDAKSHDFAHDGNHIRQPFGLVSTAVTIRP